MIEIRRQSVDVAGVEWLKGVFVFFVVIDHNNYLRELWPNFFRPLTFHVAGFFILSFPGVVYTNKALAAFIFDRLFRYIIPFLIFYTLYSLVFSLYQSEGLGVINYLLGLFVGSFELVKKGCGGAFMWFLPALFGFSVLVRFLSMAKNIVLNFSLISCFVFHYFVSELSYVARVYDLFGAFVALYVVPIVIAFYISNEFLSKLSGARFGLALLAVFFSGVLAYFYLVNSSVNIELGALAAPPVERPGLIFGSLFSTVSILVAIFQLSKFKFLHFNWVIALGKSSLIVYLTHPFFLAVLGKVFLKMGWENNSESLLLTLGVAATAMAILLSLYVAKFFSKNLRLQAFVFPRNGSHFMTAFEGIPSSDR